jgi:hypothetical protein
MEQDGRMADAGEVPGRWTVRSQRPSLASAALFFIGPLELSAFSFSILHLP